MQIMMGWHDTHRLIVASKGGGPKLFDTATREVLGKVAARVERKLDKGTLPMYVRVSMSEAEELVLAYPVLSKRWLGAANWRRVYHPNRSRRVAPSTRRKLHNTRNGPVGGAGGPAHRYGQLVQVRVPSGGPSVMGPRRGRRGRGQR